MNITQEADYAIRALLILAKEGEGEKLDAKTISERGRIPLRFLLKLLRKLIQAGIVRSYRGVNGGYALNRHSKDINLREVIEAIDGSISINRCIIDKDFCNENNTERCVVHKELKKVQSILVNELEKITLFKLKNS